MASPLPCIWAKRMRAARKTRSRELATAPFRLSMSSARVRPVFLRLRMTSHPPEHDVSASEIAWGASVFESGSSSCYPSIRRQHHQSARLPITARLVFLSPWAFCILYADSALLSPPNPVVMGSARDTRLTQRLMGCRRSERRISLNRVINVPHRRYSLGWRKFNNLARLR